MNSDILEEFVCLAETLNFTEAAKKCFIAQPALSKHIASLEKELGTELFWRDRRHVELTPAGKAILEDARSAVASCKRVTDTAQLHRQGLVGEITAGYLRAAAESTLPIAHAKFHASYPLIELVYETRSYYDLISSLESGAIDIALGARFDLINALDVDEYESITLFDDVLCAVASEHHWLSAREKSPLTISDFSHAKILTLPISTPFTNKQKLSDLFKSEKVSVEFLDRFDNLEKLPMQLASEGCVAILPSHLRTYFDEAHMGTFRFMPVKELHQRFTYTITWKKANAKRGIREYAEAFSEAFIPPKTIPF